MDGNLKVIQQTVDDIVLAELKSTELMGSLLMKENEILKNSQVGRIACILKKWSSTPSVEILNELERVVKNGKRQEDSSAKECDGGAR